MRQRRGSRSHAADLAGSSPDAPNPKEREILRVLAWLGASFPVSFPVELIRSLDLPHDEAGAAWWLQLRGRDRLLIVLHEQLSLSDSIETLHHEWSHALAIEESDRWELRSEHDDAFWILYGRIYRAWRRCDLHRPTRSARLDRAVSSCLAGSSRASAPASIRKLSGARRVLRWLEAHFPLPFEVELTLNPNVSLGASTCRRWVDERGRRRLQILVHDRLSSDATIEALVHGWAQALALRGATSCAPSEPAYDDRFWTTYGSIYRAYFEEEAPEDP